MTAPMKTVTLYRPVGPVERDLIEATGWTKFPRRLPGQGRFTHEPER
jgi:hypothetical protein